MTNYHFGQGLDLGEIMKLKCYLFPYGENLLTNVIIRSGKCMSTRHGITVREKCLKISVGNQKL